MSVICGAFGTRDCGCESANLRVFVVQLLLRRYVAACRSMRDASLLEDSVVTAMIRFRAISLHGLVCDAYSIMKQSDRTVVNSEGLPAK
jgi:hypothetical protein